ncbi:MAG: hypothetical protein Q9212_000591 [Teloschistes hypoglaucus]
MRSHHPLLIRLLTHNIRYATDSPFLGEEKWAIRAPRIVGELRFNSAHCGEAFICLQEVFHQQLVDILSGLNREHEGAAEEWAFIGVGRDDGKQAGEYSPIFYRPSVWTLQDWETVWLSETPSKPSRGWDAASTRILTIGLFQHRASKKQLVAMNTHLDDQGATSRSEAANIILTKIEEKSQDGRLPLFLAGDFNSQRNDDAYLKLTGTTSSMEDVQEMWSIQEGDGYGHTYTFTGFADDARTIIDFLFLNQASCAWAVHNFGILENKFDDQVYYSDHRAVVADVAIAPISFPDRSVQRNRQA